MQEDRDRLVENNLKLVHYVVHKYFSRIPCLGDYDDKVQIGCIGLCKAARSFRRNKGYAFSTYAVKCIYNEIAQAVRREYAKSRGGKENMLSLDELFGEDAAPLADLITDPFADIERQLDAQNSLERVAQAFEDEPVLLAVVTRQMTQYEASVLLGISQAQVSRKIKAIIEKHMKKEDPHDQDQHERDSELS